MGRFCTSTVKLYYYIINLINYRWIISLCGFVFYYIIFFTAFMNRPFSMTTSVIVQKNLMEDDDYFEVISKNQYIGDKIYPPINDSSIIF